MGDMRNAYTILVGKPKGKRLLGAPRRRREDNIRMDRVGRGGLDACGLGYGPLTGSCDTVMNLLVP